MDRYTIPPSSSRRPAPSAARTAQVIFAMIVLATFRVTDVHAAAPPKANDLVKSMTKATAFLGKVVKEAGPAKLSPKNNRQKTFFAALKKTNSSLASVTKSLASKNDKAFLKSLDRAGRSIAELQRATKLGEITDPKVAQGLKALAGAYSAVAKSFSKAALRRKKGGALTPQETKHATELVARYQKAYTQLQTARSKSSKAPGVIAEVAVLADSVNRILGPGRAGGGAVTLEWYTELVAYETEFCGSWYAVASYDSIVDPGGYQTAFAPINASFAEVASYTETVETSISYESAEFWSSYESSAIETTESYDVAITDTEISTYEEYIEETSLDVSVDEYDVTLGDDDATFLDHDDDGSFDTADNDDDGDGIDDAKDLDDDGDGIDDFAEMDSDHDGTPDALDDDDDNDGMDDDADKDDDNDGILDAKDHDDDNDNDGIPDAKDADDDNDGTPDAKDDDEDGDGVDDDVDDDDDNDGIDDADDADHDEDGDGTPDDADADDDNDGTPDDADADDDNDGTPDAEDDDHGDDDGDDAGDDDGGDDDGGDDAGDDGGDDDGGDDGGGDDDGV